MVSVRTWTWKSLFHIVFTIMFKIIEKMKTKASWNISQRENTDGKGRAAFPPSSSWDDTVAETKTSPRSFSNVDKSKKKKKKFALSHLQFQLKLSDDNKLQYQSTSLHSGLLAKTGHCDTWSPKSDKEILGEWVLLETACGYRLNPNT